MERKESGEMYLESIYVLSQNSDFVRAADVARYMGYSEPSVCRAVRNLKNGGYLSQGPSKRLHLTDFGKQCAQMIHERHTVLTAFLKAIGVSESIASEDARSLGHCASEESYQAIRKLLLMIENDTKFPYNISWDIAHQQQESDAECRTSF